MNAKGSVTVPNWTLAAGAAFLLWDRFTAISPFLSSEGFRSFATSAIIAFVASVVLVVAAIPFVVSIWEDFRLRLSGIELPKLPKLGKSPSKQSSKSSKP